MRTLKKFFQDKKGNVVIFQTPNLPIIVWLVAMLASKLAREGTAHTLADLVAFGSLFTWAYLEIRDGDSPFRRALGVIALVFTLYNRL